MEAILIPAAVLVAVTALGDVLAARLRVPPAMLLVSLGAALSFVPHVPRVTIDPQIVLLLFLPPLIYASGVGMSWRGFRNNLRPILLLAIGCVLFTASAVAAAGHAWLAMSWPVAFLLGAVVSPPDPIAPMAIARRLKLPRRLLTILEGEGVVNDATALILVSFAVAAATDHRLTMVAAGTRFVTIVVGEIGWGIAVGWVVLRLRHRLAHPQAEILLALLTPFLAFWPPHLLGGSGVLAALAAGLHTSWCGPRFIAPSTRLQGYFVWGLIVHALEGLLFLLMGLQARSIGAGLDGSGWQRLAAAAAIVALVVIVVRFVWVFLATWIPRALGGLFFRLGLIRRSEAPVTPWSYRFIIGFTGIRGVVSLAAALSIPTLAGDVPFPDRSLILFVAFFVIIVTLLGQGSALPLLLPRLGLVAAGEAEGTEAKAREVEARIAGIEAALAELAAAKAEGAPPGAVATLSQRNENRRRQYADTADTAIAISPVAEESLLHARLIGAERREIASLYAAGRISDDARRRIERELDLEDASNRHALESATGDRLADPEVSAWLD